MNPDETPTQPTQTPDPQNSEDPNVGSRQFGQPEKTSGGDPLEREFASESTPPSKELGFAAQPMATETIALLEQQVADLQQQARSLRDEILSLQASKAKIWQDREQIQADMGRLVTESLSDLQQRKQALELAIEQLERRQERIRQEMRTTFAGMSQDLAIRVQGFKDYLVGSLQDLASTAEQLDLSPSPPQRDLETPETPESPPPSVTPQFSQQAFQEQTRQIRRLLDEYRHQPNYYGPPWQLRRTFEPVHAERVSNWFFAQGGRGALRTMNSRLQNILIASAIVSVLHSLYDRRLCVLVLANTPERLGEWRRGLQDCLGISRTDFSPNRGVVLFEDPQALAQKADRLEEVNRLPLILIDESEGEIPLSLLQFPLWLAFAADPETANFY